MSKAVDNLTETELFGIEGGLCSPIWKLLEDVFKERENQLLDSIMVNTKDIGDFLKREQNIGSIKTLRTILPIIKNEILQKRKIDE